MTIPEFKADETRRGELARMLASPTFREAWDLALKSLIPGHVNEGVVNQNMGNAYLQQICGAQAMLAEMNGLTSAKERKGLPERRLFSESDREFLKARMAEAQEGK